MKQIAMDILRALGQFLVISILVSLFVFLLGPVAHNPQAILKILKNLQNYFLF